MVLGIDVGSTFTKFSIVSYKREIIKCFKEKTHANQIFELKKSIDEIKNFYKIEYVAACGYGKGNANANFITSELIALSYGLSFLYPEYENAVDIGGQDTKIIINKNGKMSDFILNDKCAAGAGIFLSMVLKILEIDFEDIDETCKTNFEFKPISSVCALYAQSEIIGRLAKGESKEALLFAAIDSMIVQVVTLIKRTKIRDNILLTGGLSTTNIVSNIILKKSNIEIYTKKYSEFLASIGVALLFLEKKGVNNE